MLEKANPITNELPILVRGYIAPKKPENESSSDGKKSSKRRKAQSRLSPWALVFDTETTIDAHQNLRFGTYQLRKKAALIEAGLFYNPAVMSAAEVRKIQSFASARDITAMTIENFTRDVFVKKAYELRATIVGFNLPFDISRIAARHNSARGKTMKGGFTFPLLNDPYSPYIQIKHLSSRSALIQFAQPKGNPETRSQPNRGYLNKTRRGNFVDLKTIAAALFSRSFSLASLADFLKTPSRKALTEDHGKRLTNAYLDYAVCDAQVTWECFEALQLEFNRHGLVSTTMGKVLSEASLGKAYLKDMGIKPFLKSQADFPSALIGQIMSSYYGGRSEVHIRRQVAQVLYCDFLSMYPTVCTLMNLWRFVIAEGVDWHDSTVETQGLLDQVVPDDLQNPDMWRQLHTLIRLRPEGQILPVRAKYDDVSPNIGVNYLTSEFGVWYTLADVIASKFLTQKTPLIDQAITFEPRKVQSDLKSIKIAGNDHYVVQPATDDFYRRLINLRTEIKSQIKRADESKKDALEAAQLALKLLANSTSYGIFVELISTEEADHGRKCYGIDGEGFPLDIATSEKVEDPGPFFHPLLATLITGAARLMLALAEIQAESQGLDWAFCDTDSMAIAKPDDWSNSDFFKRANAVCSWFDPLNPYEMKGPFFKIEDANFGLDGEHLEPLFCYCISSKRYVLFNYGEGGEPIIRKASAHGLGHLLPAYGDENAPTAMPTPKVRLSEIGVDRWQYDLWMKILEAAHSANSEAIDLDYHQDLNRPAFSRYSATSPELLRWFNSYNEGEPKEKQVKPFNFLLALIAKPQSNKTFGAISENPKPGRPKKKKAVSPVAPFSKDLEQAARQAFDRETGAPVHPSELVTYREAIAQYHLHPEAKFMGGDYIDKGHTRRRHIRALAANYIGKESNRLEEQYFIGIKGDELLELRSGDRRAVEDRLKVLTAEMSQRKLAKMLGLGRSTLAKALSGGLDALSRGARRQLEIRLIKIEARNPDLSSRIGAKLKTEKPN